MAVAWVVVKPAEGAAASFGAVSSGVGTPTRHNRLLGSWLLLFPVTSPFPASRSALRRSLFYSLTSETQNSEETSTASPSRAVTSPKRKPSGQSPLVPTYHCPPPPWGRRQLLCSTRGGRAFFGVLLQPLHGVSRTLCLARLHFLGLAQSPRRHVAQVGLVGAQAPIARLSRAAPAGFGRLAMLPVCPMLRPPQGHKKLPPAARA